MTKEQEKRVIDNENLIYKCAHDLHLQVNEDVLQEGRLALCKASNRYTSERKTSFSTYAYAYIRGYLLTYMNKTSCIIAGKRSGTTYKKVGVALFSDFGIIDIVDNIADPYNYIDIDVFFRDVNLSLDTTTAKVGKLLYQGYSKQQIRDDLKLNYTIINQCIEKLKKYIKEYFYE